jgi:predicted RND superfamily exporter protein
MIKTEESDGEFLPAVSKIVKELTGAYVSSSLVSPLAVQQLYIIYFYETGVIPEGEILGRDFVNFVIDTYPKNSVIADRLSPDSRAKLNDLRAVDNFFADKTEYAYTDMATKIADLQSSITSMSSGEALSANTVSGVYVKHSINNGIDLAKGVMAFELLDFVVANMNDNELLKSKMNEETREKVEKAKNDIKSAGELFIGENYSRMLLSVNLPSEGEESGRFVEYLIATVKEVFGQDAHVGGEIVSTYDLGVAFGKDNTFISIFTIVSIFLIVMIVFRSLSLPTLLVAVIQGAIWICMSTSLISGPMFFMSYIMATCILMGATIDYGILMSNNYVRFRETLDKKEALYAAVASAMPTIFTSGLILTICGFVVGFVASQNSISSVGFLLGKGTLISVAMITLVLPAALHLFDGFILKYTKKK